MDGARPATSNRLDGRADRRTPARTREAQARAAPQSSICSIHTRPAFIHAGAEIMYEHLLLIFLLGFLAGVCIRPARAMVRATLRAHKAARRAAHPIRKRQRRRSNGIY